MGINKDNCWECGSIYGCCCSPGKGFRARERLQGKITEHLILRRKRAEIEIQLQEVGRRINEMGQQIRESIDNRKVMFT